MTAIILVLTFAQDVAGTSWARGPEGRDEARFASGIAGANQDEASGGYELHISVDGIRSA